MYTRAGVLLALTRARSAWISEFGILLILALLGACRPEPIIQAGAYCVPG